jgi:hypothetical protein
MELHSHRESGEHLQQKKEKEIVFRDMIGGSDIDWEQLSILGLSRLGKPHFCGILKLKDKFLDSFFKKS